MPMGSPHQLTPWEAFLREPLEETFAPVYEETRALVWTICLRMLRSEEDAADALQGAYARLLVWARDPVDPPASAGPERVMRRLAVLEADRLRKRRSRRLAKEVAVSELPVIADRRPSAAQAAAGGEARRILETLIAEMPERYRVPLLLHFFHGMTHREIADALGKPPTTISSQIQRGLRRLEPKARRAGLADARSSLLALGTAAVLFVPPEELTAHSVFATADTLLRTPGWASSSAAASTPPTNCGSSAALVAAYAAALALMVLPALVLWPGHKERAAAKEPSNPGILVIHHEDPEQMAADLEAARLSRPEADFAFPIPERFQRAAKNFTTVQH